MADYFGFHAVQIGLNDMPLMRNSHIKNCWLADNSLTRCQEKKYMHFYCNSAALPFAENSIDAILLPHTLECSHTPHATLREVQRVLIPEGRLIIIGFNPKSLWGAQYVSNKLAQRLGISRGPFIADIHEPISYRRLRDWLNLLDFDISAGCFGNYRPSLRTSAWFQHLQALELIGNRWFPTFGGVYFLQATKRVHSMRLTQPTWKIQKTTHTTPIVVTPKYTHTQ